MGCKAAVQALQKADTLKAKITRNCDLLKDAQAWTDQQQLQTIYHQVLVLDLEYALDKKVEQELWTVGFKNHITALQEQARDKRNPQRSESQALLSWCLEAASGFYLTLLHELCTAFDLDLPFRKKLNMYGQTKWTYTEQLNPPQTSSCIYICQYCLVHLGDIARYRNQRKQAESFYKHAILLSPTSGQPYNQLALLEASQGDKLATIFYYVRGIAVKNPFPATATNLGNTLSNAIDKDDAITEVQTKLTVNELIRMFVRVHGLLYLGTDLDQAELGVKNLNATLTPLVATQSFTDQRLLQMTVVNLYALKHTVGAGTLKSEELTEDELKVRKLVLDLLAGSLSAFLLPVYTLNQDCTILDYYALPAIKFILYWIQREPEVLKESVFRSRLQIWPGLCKLLNGIQNHLKEFEYNEYEKVPLAEDRELQGFLPLSEPFKELDFKSADVQENTETEKLIRAKRLIDFGTWLSTFDVDNAKLIIVKDELFEPGSVQPDPTTQLLEEMKSLHLVEIIKVESKATSKTFSNGNDGSNPIEGNETVYPCPDLTIPCSTEKKGGILKPQGSLEKSRREQETLGLLKDSSVTNVTVSSTISNKSDSVKLKRVSQNVALQSIFKKMEESKQVKFDMGIAEKEKLPKVDIKLPNNTKPPTAYLNQQFRNNIPYSQNLTTPNDYFKNSFQNHFSSNMYDRNPGSNPIQNHDVPVQPHDILSKLPPNMNTNSFSFPPPQPQHLFNPPVQNMTQNVIQRQQIPMPYPFPPSNEFNPWRPDERPSANFWPNPNQPAGNQPNFQQREYQVNFPYIQQSNPPSWNSMPSTNQGSVGFEHPNQGLSLRQAMLKETKNIPPIQGMPIGSHRENPEKTMPVQTTTPGYSLFNSSSWSPSLPGQFRNNETSSEGLIHNLRQQSLFSRQAPLQQLLERQNQMSKGDS